MDNNLNLFLIENKSKKMKNNEDEIQNKLYLKPNIH